MNSILIQQMGARLIRFVADGCKQKTVLAQADRVPIASGAYERWLC